MTHSDDEGLVLPPNLAPIQVVIVPIYKGIEQLDTISERIDPIIKNLRAKGISVKFDTRDTINQVSNLQSGNVKAYLCVWP